MELTVLGCGDAFGNGGRFNTSFLLTYEQEHVLIDCGASTLISLKKEGIDVSNISTIVISHFHGDHFGGLPFILISALYELPPNQELTIVGPAGVQEKTMSLLQAMYPGTVEQVDKLKLRFVAFNQEGSLIIDDKKITALPVAHSPDSCPHGVRLEWHDRVIAFSGDTSWSDSLIALSKNADIFICECNFMKSVDFGHLGYEELIEKRHLLQSKQLWLTHMNDEVFNSPQVKMNRLHDGLKISL